MLVYQRVDVLDRIADIFPQPSNLCDVAEANSWGELQEQPSGWMWEWEGSIKIATLGSESKQSKNMICWYLLIVDCTQD